jgi:hypothetical protein
VQKFDPAQKVQLTNDWTYVQIELLRKAADANVWQADLVGYANPRNFDGMVEIWWPRTEQQIENTQLDTQVSALLNEKVIVSQGWLMSPRNGFVNHVSSLVEKASSSRAIRPDPDLSMLVPVENDQVSLHIEVRQPKDAVAPAGHFLLGMRTIPVGARQPQDNRK